LRIVEGMLWDRSDLATLRSFANAPGQAHRRLSDGADVWVESWTVRFPVCEPSRLPEGGAKKTYASKPLVAPFGQPLFGELAILRCLERDGWSGVWVDTYHGAELFWRDMPHQSSPVDLHHEPASLEVYRAIVSTHGKRGGFFDVFAWRDTDVVFIEYKGKGDRPNANETSWIEAALRYGITSSQLLFVEYASRDPEQLVGASSRAL